MSSRMTPRLFALAACGGAYKAPPAVDRIDLPNADALKPYDPSKPGHARPQVMAELGGTVYVTLSNLRQDYSIAGPGFLAAFVTSTGAVTLLDLGGQDGKQCQSPAFVRAGGSKLYATCGGDFVAQTGRAVLEVDPSGAISHALAVPTSPSGVAVELAAVLVMPLLGLAKGRANSVIDSTALRADIVETATCAYMAAATLVGTTANLWLGWWWAEYAAALVLLFWLVGETREAFEEAREDEDGSE